VHGRLIYMEVYIYIGSYNISYIFFLLFYVSFLQTSKWTGSVVNVSISPA
jgi:hypothetical protein